MKGLLMLPHLAKVIRGYPKVSIPLLAPVVLAGKWVRRRPMTAIFGRMATYSGKVLKWDQCLNSERVESPVEKYTSFDDLPPHKPDADGWYALPLPGKTEVL